MKKYDVWTLDVWGSDGDWTVNDRTRAGTIELVNIDDDEEFLKALQQINIIKKNVKLSDLDFSGDDEQIWINEKLDGYPLVELDLIDEEVKQISVPSTILDRVVTLLDYSEENEKQHYEEGKIDGAEEPNHIYLKIKAIRGWLDKNYKQ